VMTRSLPAYGMVFATRLMNVAGGSRTWTLRADGQFGMERMLRLGMELIRLVTEFGSRAELFSDARSKVTF
jgi:hypothetical protein